MVMVVGSFPNVDFNRRSSRSVISNVNSITCGKVMNTAKSHNMPRPAIKTATVGEALCKTPVRKAELWQI